MLSGALPPTPVPPTSVAVFLAQAGLLTARPLAHHHRDGHWKDLSWIELREHALRIAGGLVQAGVDAGDRVILLTENRVEWLACDLGIQMAGAATVAIRPSASPEITQRIAWRSAAVLAIVSGEDLAARLHLTDALGRIVRLDGQVARWLRSAPDERSSAEVRRRLSALVPDDVATVDFPAGTPAGVLVSHRDLVGRARGCVEAFGVGPNDHVLFYLRCADVSERLWGLLVPVVAGATVWLARGVAQTGEDVDAARPTLMRCSPAVLAAIQQRGEVATRSWPGLRRAALDRAMAIGRERARERNPGLGLRLRHRIADRLVLSSLRRSAGGGRLRYLVTGDAPLTRAVEELFPAIGLPVHQGCGRSV